MKGDLGFSKMPGLERRDSAGQGKEFLRGNWRPGGRAVICYW